MSEDAVRQKIEVVLINWWGNETMSLADFFRVVGKAWEKMNSDERRSAVVEFEDGDGYGGSGHLHVKYDRNETDAEMATRLQEDGRREERYAREREREERSVYERLKAKFEEAKSESNSTAPG